jgi:exodeoxyribonuclease V alpha subunit
MPELRTAESGSDFYLVERDTPEEIAATLIKLIRDRMPKRLRLDSIRDIQVMCPMNRGSIAVWLQRSLQAIVRESGSVRTQPLRQGSITSVWTSVNRRR